VLETVNFPLWLELSWRKALFFIFLNPLWSPSFSAAFSLHLWTTVADGQTGPSPREAPDLSPSAPHVLPFVVLPFSPFLPGLPETLSTSKVRSFVV